MMTDQTTLVVAILLRVSGWRRLLEVVREPMPELAEHIEAMLERAPAVLEAAVEKEATAFRASENAHLN